MLSSKQSITTLGTRQGSEQTMYISTDPHMSLVCEMVLAADTFLNLTRSVMQPKLRNEAG